jgi:hypothetical protein
MPGPCESEHEECGVQPAALAFDFLLSKLTGWSQPVARSLAEAYPKFLRLQQPTGTMQVLTCGGRIAAEIKVNGPFAQRGGDNLDLRSPFRIEPWVPTRTVP